MTNFKKKNLIKFSSFKKKKQSLGGIITEIAHGQNVP